MVTPVLHQSRNQLVRDSFRRWGYLEAELDFLGRLKPQPHPELQWGDEESAAEARRRYCGTIGVEFMHIPDPARRQWVADRMEADSEPPDRNRILDLLIRTAVFEQVLQNRYLGNKRFSIEGVDALVPLLVEMLEAAASHRTKRVIMAMSHRGRMPVTALVVGRPAAEVVAGFEDVDPKSILGSGDVKYHLGATGTFRSRAGGEVAIHLVSNPSHLEAVDPVALGRVKAWQTRLGDEGGRDVVPIIMHGDAAFAGQGILAEVLNLSSLRGFSVGGTIHVIVNNLLGFTASPEELYSSRFASDVAKRLPIPIFHVNAEDPEAAARVAKLATDYRYQFGSDVIVDLIGYRRHGHSEVDDPTITQPLIYRRLKERPPLWQLYAEQARFPEPVVQERLESARNEMEAAHDEARKLKKRPMLRELPPYWEGYFGGRYDPDCEVDTGLDVEEIGDLARRISVAPEGFHVHDKIEKLLQQRLEMGAGKRPVDFGMAEALAFASLLRKGFLVRLTGQDCKRGTFNQRHAYLIDVETEDEYAPLQHLGDSAGKFECFDSMLSEAAVLGFEYGLSRDYPDGLVLWEAQFGDFANGAQMIIDQFVTAGEEKWSLLSGLVMLLPHGFEGQGPEHSSARVERFLQLAARDNIQAAQPSTAAQYFHLLRRQALRKWRKPLIVFTPKSMLRHPSAVSELAEFQRSRFQTVIPDKGSVEASRIFVCTGKIGHELLREREKRGDRSSAVVFLEQLFPFPERELKAEFERHGSAREIVWVQEEPANMGALFFVVPRIHRIAGRRSVRSVKRSASGTPSTGSAKAHEVEQKTLLMLAFSKIGQ